MASPDIVSIGHVSWDVHVDYPFGKMPGGAASFATVLAREMGLRAAIVTAAAGDYPIDDVAPTNLRSVIESPATTTFESRHDDDGVRHQRLVSRARALEVADVPDDWLTPSVLFVAPLSHELPLDCLNWFRPRISCVVPQGWCRAWSEPLPSPVMVVPDVPEGMSNMWNICVISEHETARATLEDWRLAADYVVVTRGERGATLYGRSEPEGIQIPAANHVLGVGTETTGAGDVFAAALAIGIAKGSEPVEAATAASEWAAKCTTAPSWRGIVKSNPS